MTMMMIIKIRGTFKKYHGDPTYVFQGKEDICLVRWISKESIVLDILIAIVEILGYSENMDRSERRIRFLLVDVHSSRFVLNFLYYICNKIH